MRRKAKLPNAPWKSPLQRVKVDVCEMLIESEKCARKVNIYMLNHAEFLGTGSLLTSG